MSFKLWIGDIQGYLADNQTQAFISTDLATRVRGRNSDGLVGLNDSDFEKALNTMVGDGSVKANVISGLQYYSYNSYSKQ